MWKLFQRNIFLNYKCYNSQYHTQSRRVIVISRGDSIEKDKPPERNNLSCGGATFFGKPFPLSPTISRSLSGAQFLLFREDFAIYGAPPSFRIALHGFARRGNCVPDSAAPGGARGHWNISLANWRAAGQFRDCVPKTLLFGVVANTVPLKIYAGWVAMGQCRKKYIKMKILLASPKVKNCGKQKETSFRFYVDISGIYYMG